MSKIDILHSAGLIALIIVIFGLGYYFGFRVAVVQAENEAITQDVQQSQQVLDQPIETTPIEVVGVAWMPPGGSSECPETHPVKGKFTSTGNVAYTPEHKSYNRVTAHLCFATIEYAIESANFFEKQ